VYFFGVSDGLGEEPASRIASKLVLDSSVNFLRKQLQNGFSGFSSGLGKNLVSRLYIHAHDAIAETVEACPDYTGMAATLCTGILADDELFLGNIGSSHSMLLSDNTLTAFTLGVHLNGKLLADHENKDAGQVSLQNHQVCPRLVNGHMVPPAVFPRNKHSVELKPGDMLLFCSNGILGNALEQAVKQVKTILQRNRSNPEQAAEKLWQLALNNGAGNHASLIVATYNPPRQNRLLSMFW
jgi:serine/threonine protein phosphatase PrpC